MVWGVQDDDIDGMLLAQIRTGRATLWGITGAMHELWPAADLATLHYRAAARLQRLRELGRIRFDRVSRQWKECDK